MANSYIPARFQYTGSAVAALAEFQPSDPMVLPGDVFIKCTADPIIAPANGGGFSGGSLRQFRTAGSAGSPVYIGRGDGGFLVQFVKNSNTQIGSIMTDGTVTMYGTTSDYRLKHTVVDLNKDEAAARIMAYRPVTWLWNVNETYGKGFIAHEVQAVDPLTASGQKDAVERLGNIRLPDYTLVAEGVTEPQDMSEYQEGAEWIFTEDRPVYQVRDDSKMIPDMVAMMQRQEARILDLEEKLRALLAA